jgi:hypothetical protein
MLEVLLVIPGAAVVIGAVYAFVRPRDEDEVAVLESPSRQPRSRSDA